MKFRTILTAAAIALLPVVATAATIVIPGAGTGPGANNSQWQSELTLHSSAPRAIEVNISFHQSKSVLGPVKVSLAARETRSFADVAKTMFGVNAGSGALVIDVDDRNVRYVAATSRTFNTAPEGEFGQDVPAIRLDDAVNAGSIGSINGPSSVATTRFNFGIYAAEATTVKWELVRANGTVVAATSERNYAAGEHAQYNNGVETLFGLAPQNNDAVQGRVTAGSALFFGSIINATGDPTYVPGIPTRDDILIVFGVDRDENGNVDVTDADGDGVLDGTIDLFTGVFPNFFRIVAQGEFGEPVQLEILSSPSEASIDSNGTLRTAAFDGLKGKTGKITVRAIAAGTSTILTIPVRYR